MTERQQRVYDAAFGAYFAAESSRIKHSSTNATLREQLSDEQYAAAVDAYRDALALEAHLVAMEAAARVRS